MRKRKIFSLIALVLIVALLAACGGGGTSSPAADSGSSAQPDASAPATDGASQAAEPAADPKKDSVVVAINNDITSLMPYINNSNVNNQVLFHPYEPLIFTNFDMQIEPCLAESWEESADGMTWTFKLRQGVKFHDGSDFDATDVLASYELARTDKSVYKNFFSRIDTIEAPDAYTVVLNMNMKYPLLLHDLALVNILSSEKIQGKEVDDPSLVETANVIGTGRYKFVEHVKEDHVDFTRNDDHWSGEAANWTVKNIRFRPISNAATRTATMLSGELDVMANVSVHDVARLEAADNVKIVREKSMEHIYIDLEHSAEDNPGVEGPGNPFKDLKVRKALYQAIDTDAIINNIMMGYAYPTASLVRDIFNGYAGNERYPYDPEAAKALLAEAGYPDGFTMTIDAGSELYVNSSEIAQAVAGYWEKIGITVELNLQPTSTFLPYIRPYESNTGCIITAWSVYTGEGITMLSQHFETYNQEKGLGTANRGHFSNAEVDRLIGEALQESDYDKRGELTAQVDKIVHEEIACIPLFVQDNIFAISADIEYTPRFNKYVHAWEIKIL